MSDRGSIFVLQSNVPQREIYLGFSNRFLGKGVYRVIKNLIVDMDESGEIFRDSLLDSINIYLLSEHDKEYFRALDESMLQETYQYSEEALMVNPVAKTVTNLYTKKWCSFDFIIKHSIEDIEAYLNKS